MAQLLPHGAPVLDVGTGDGRIARAIMDIAPSITIEGVDVIVRDRSQINVTLFDGRRLPYDDNAFDTIMFVDVLHHCEDPQAMLKEASRVARRRILIKDHLLEGLFASSTLKLMDWMGNSRHGVALPHNYWTRDRWRREIAKMNWSNERWNERVSLYPWPASLLFGRSLHFVASLYIHTNVRKMQADEDESQLINDRSL